MIFSEQEKPGRSKLGEASLDAQIYGSGGYLTRPILDSLCEQIVTIAELNAENVLEVGKGNGLVSWYLKRCGIATTTVDINPSLEPDYCGSVTDLVQIVGENSHDWVLCAEVLEHIPLDEAMTALAQIAAVARKGAVISLPRCQKNLFSLNFKVGSSYLKGLRKVGGRGVDLFIPKFGAARIESCHHWEIGHAPETSLARILDLMQAHFAVRKTWNSRRQRYHQFFVLEIR